MEEVPIGVRLGQWAEAQPDRTALIDDARSVTWRELHRRTNRIARGLETVGIGFGDLVSVGLPNEIDFVEACFALWKIGATPQPISTRLPAEEARAIMDLAETPILIGNADLGGGRPTHTVGALLDRSGDESDLPPKIAPCFKAPTSGGSTGRPKLILSGQRGAVVPGEPGIRKIRPDDAVLMPAPIYYNGPFVSVIEGLLAGATVVLRPRFDAEDTLRAIERYRVTWVYVVPTMMSRISKLPPDIRGRYDVSSLREVWHMAAPCPPWLKREWIDWLGPETILELYGGTEGQAITVLNGREWLDRPGSVGRVAFGEMKIVGPDGRTLPPGDEGEIWMRAPPGKGPTYTYRGAESRCGPDGWDTLGDIGSMDRDGYVFLADRRTDMIVVGGVNVYPAEIEAALDSHPEVDSSAVIGLPDDEMGARVHALIRLREAASEEALMAHLRERLARHKLPRSIEFTTDTLRDDGGKVRRSQLRRERMPAGA